MEAGESSMSRSRIVCVVVLFVSSFIFAFELQAQDPKPAEPVPANPSSPAHQARTGREYSGMYSFLKDGEFVQITVEDEGKVTGFLSRYAESESGNGPFLEQYFRSARLEGNKLTFTTETKQLEWFEFKGTVERGDGKDTGDEAYYVLKGTLIDNTSDGAKKVNTHTHDVLLKRFPEEASRN